MIPVVLIIAANFVITSNEIRALQYELLTNNVSYILAKSESDFDTIDSLGMTDVEFYTEATKQVVLRSIAKNLAPGTSISIIDAASHEVIFTTGDNKKTYNIDAKHIQSMVSKKNGRTELARTSTFSGINDRIAVFDHYPNWNWIVVSFSDGKQLFRHTDNAMILSFALFGLFFPLIFIGVYKLSNGVTRTIVALDRGAQKISKNEFDVKIDIERNDEFGSLANSFNIMSSELKKTQNQLNASILEERKSSIDLSQSRKQYQGLVEDTPDLITRVDAEGRFLFVNHAAQLIFGLPANDCIGRSAFDFVHPDDRASTVAEFESWLASNTSSFKFENRQLSLDGRVHHMAWLIRVEYDHNGDVCGTANYARDVTAQKNVEVERLKLESQLQQVQKMEAVGQLAGGIAHDFNNMLGVILGHTELALIRSEQGRSITINLDGILKATNHSKDLTQQLLSFARKQNIEPKILDLNESIENTMLMLERLIGENIILTFNAGENLWPVNIDPTQLDQVLANLCVNARDAITDGGHITITTINSSFDSSSDEQDSFAPPPGDYVQISVSDDGAGMSRAIMSRIFEPFYTTKGPTEGTGLGLSTVFGAIKQNNGYIMVSSEEGFGTLFTVFLSPEKSASLAVEEPDQTVARGGIESILVVEDDELLLDVETTMLTDSGYTVLAAATPEIALKLARSHSGEIDLLLTDVIMPEMNGWELSAELVALRPTMKVLFMSGYTAEIIDNESVISGEVHFLQKPFQMDALIRKVREVMES